MSPVYFWAVIASLLLGPVLGFLIGLRLRRQALDLANLEIEARQRACRKLAGVIEKLQEKKAGRTNG